MHATLPVVDLYEPAAHDEQEPPSGPVKPALHVHMLDALQPLHDAPEFDGHVIHVVAIVAPAVAEYDPTPQLVHAAEPVVFLYVPGTQEVHGLPSRLREEHLFAQA